MAYTLCYVSSSRDDLSASDLEHLFYVNKRNNTELNISGILIYNHGNFLQILEGEEQKITSLFKKISQDKRHNSIIKLIESTISERIFDDYENGFVLVNDNKKLSELQQYLNWIKEAEMKNVDKVIKIVENFIEKT